MDFRPNRKTRDGYLAVPASGAGPGVVVLHAWWGLNGFFTGLCDRLAREGFVALAPDLFGGKIAKTVPEAEVLRDLHEAGAEQAEEIVLASLDRLCSRPEMSGRPAGVIGFSMGAWWAVQLATKRPDDIAAAVLFYGTGWGDFSASRCAYQGHFAENDPYEPSEQLKAVEAEIRAAGREASFHFYPGAGHWFFEDDRPDAYSPEAARLAWDRTVEFLKEHLQPAAV